MDVCETHELGVSDAVLDEIRDLAAVASREPAEDDLPEGTRQILLVSGYHMFSANFLESAASGKTDSRVVLLLTGKHSPSSHPELRMAYVTFVDDNTTVRRPGYSRAQGTIRLWMRYRELPNVLAQLREPNVYCWIGHFGQGHLHGDIHTSR